jgi:hypothetical protein
LLPGSAGADTSPLSTFGVILLTPTLAVNWPALWAEAAAAAVIAQAATSSVTALFKR